MTGGRRTAAGVALLAIVVVACHRQPRPTYEYEATETYTSTATDATPHRVPPPEPVDAVTPGGDDEERSEPPSPAAEPAAREPTQTPEASEVPEAPEAPPARWYKAKSW